MPHGFITESVLKLSKKIMERLLSALLLVTIQVAVTHSKILLPGAAVSESDLKEAASSKNGTPHQKDCASYLEWVPLSEIWTETGNMDALRIGKDHVNLFACRVEFNGKIHFGKGVIVKAGMRVKGDNLRKSSAEFPYLPKESAMLQPKCLIADGSYETVLHSGFSIMKNPPADKFQLEWKHFNQNFSTWEATKTYLNENVAMNLDLEGDNGYIGQCRLADTYSMKHPIQGNLKQKRQKRFILKEDDSKYNKFVGYVTPNLPVEILVPYGNAAWRCDDFNFLTCTSNQ